MLQRLKARLKAENIELNVTNSAKQYIADFGYDSVFGARPLKRFLQTHAETPIARYLIEKDPPAGTLLTLDRGEGGLVLR